MAGRGFEPLKATPAILQTAPFGHSGIPPFGTKRQGHSGRHAGYSIPGRPISLGMLPAPPKRKRTSSVGFFVLELVDEALGLHRATFDVLGLVLVHVKMIVLTGLWGRGLG